MFLQGRRRRIASFRVLGADGMAPDPQQNDTSAWSKHMVSVATGAGSQNLKAVKAAGARGPVNGQVTA